MRHSAFPGLRRYNPARKNRHLVRRMLMIRRLFAAAPAFGLLCAAPLAAQLDPAKNDPLSRLSAAQSGSACSASEASSCAEAAGKLLPLILRDSPMIENLRKLTDGIGGRVTGTPEMAKAVQWAVAGFRAAGVDVHTEKYTLPVTWKESATRLAVTAPRSASFTLRAVSE